MTFVRNEKLRARDWIRTLVEIKEEYGTFSVGHVFQIETSRPQRKYGPEDPHIIYYRLKDQSGEYATYQCEMGADWAVIIDNPTINEI